MLVTAVEDHRTILDKSQLEDNISCIRRRASENDRDQLIVERKAWSKWCKTKEIAIEDIATKISASVDKILHPKNLLDLKVAHSAGALKQSNLHLLVLEKLLCDFGILSHNCRSSCRSCYQY